MTEMQETIRDYILQRCVEDENRNYQIEETTPLMSSGLVDSMGIIVLIGFLETTYNIRISEEETTIKTFDTLKKIERFVQRRIEDANEE
jgi:acyl carrier protein